MSSEKDIEQFIEDLQKKFLKNADDVESLISKLDANKNRKLLRKVKDLIREVYGKVGNVREKVGKAYKRLKNQESLENDRIDNVNIANENATSNVEERASLKESNPEGNLHNDISREVDLGAKSNEERISRHKRKQVNKKAAEVEGTVDSESEVGEKDTNARCEINKENDSENKKQSARIEKSNVNSESGKKKGGVKAKLKKKGGVCNSKENIEINNVVQESRDNNKAETGESNEENREKQVNIENGSETTEKTLEKSKIKANNADKEKTDDNARKSKPMGSVEDKDKEVNEDKDKENARITETEQDSPLASDSDVIEATPDNSFQEESPTVDPLKENGREGNGEDMGIAETEEDSNIIEETPERSGSNFRSTLTENRGEIAASSTEISDSLEEDAEDNNENVEIFDTDGPQEELQIRGELNGNGVIEDPLKVNRDGAVKDTTKGPEGEEPGPVSNSNDTNKDNNNAGEGNDKDTEKPSKSHTPLIKLVDISKLMAPNVPPLEVMSPKPKKSVTFDNSVIVLSSSDEDTPKKTPKARDEPPLKSAMRKSPTKAECSSDSDTNENRRVTRRSERRRGGETETKKKSDSSDAEEEARGRRAKRLEKRNKAKFDVLMEARLKKKKVAGRGRGRRSDSSGSEEDKVIGKENEEKGKKEKNVLLSDDSEATKSSKSNSKSCETNELGVNDDKNDKNKKKRAKKKDLLEESSLSEGESDVSDVGDDVARSKRQPGDKPESSVPKGRRRRRGGGEVTEIDENDVKLKSEVYVRLPSFKCEDLQASYLRKKDLFEVKRLLAANMDFVRRARPSEKSFSKDRDYAERQQNKRLKITPKLGEETDERPESGDDTGREGNADAGRPSNDPSEENSDRAASLVAAALLDRVDDDSDGEEGDNGRHGASGDEGGKKNDGDEQREEASGKEDGEGKGRVPDGEEEEDEDGKDDADEDSRAKKKWKNDKLLREKIDDGASDSDDDFAKFSKKKDESRGKRRRTKKSAVISDSDSDETGRKKDDDYRAESDPSDSSASEKEEEEEREDEKEKKKKAPPRRRIKRARDSSSDDEGRSTRKQLRKMIDRDSLSETTKKAEQEEKERKARIAEKQKKYNQIFDLKSGAVTDKVVLDFDEEKDRALLSVSKKIAKQLKPHQVDGIKFMWDACFESLARMAKSPGSGCILAHCMGLGKTLQVIALAHTLLTHQDKTGVSKVMVVCPVNTVLNWKNEFGKWLPDEDDFDVYELVSRKTNSVHYERSHIVKEWHRDGGVLIIGYSMFRNLSNPDNKAIPKKLRQSFQEGLVDPGPDLVVCDEGHLLKNEKTHLSIAMNRIKTARRIVLTGTPLQNNLREYWCMVQFIKPNLLGTYKEYLNRFVNPITNGQYTDSTPHDIDIMRRRSHVLHKLLDGVVQRQDYAVLAPYLPPKQEYVLFIKLTEVQIKLYQHYMDNFAKKSDGTNKTSFLFTDFQALQRICIHPRLLLEKAVDSKDKMLDNSDSEGSLKDFIDDDDDEDEMSSSSSTSSSSGSDDSDRSGSGSDSPRKKKKKKENDRFQPSKGRKRITRAQAAEIRQSGAAAAESDSDVELLEAKHWWEEYVGKNELDDLNISAKLFLLFEILKECEEIGDKVLVFSQSLYALNCIEYFLQRIDESTQKGDAGESSIGGHSGSWAIGLDYFRLDGSSSCDNRASWCDQFNDARNTRARLFLISTKAGGLGINLVAANRVIIFDVSWNPSHDVQSIYRVYRFGQTKPCYIYRFVTYGTMEMKIYERQVTKQAISKRVIDEQQIDRHYSQNDIMELYKTDLDPTDRPIPLVPKDVLLGEMLQKYDRTIFKYHEHQSLLENKEEEGLNEEERKAAWEEFENEKIIRKTAIPNMAGMNFGAFQNSMNFSPQLIQVALANIVRKDNPTWSEVQIRGILPALVQQLQMQLSEGDFTMYNRVQQEIRLMQAIQAQHMHEKYVQEVKMRQMMQKQGATSLTGLNVGPQELRRLQMLAASQNYIAPPARGGAAAGAGGSSSTEIIDLGD